MKRFVINNFILRQAQDDREQNQAQGDKEQNQAQGDKEQNQAQGDTLFSSSSG